MSCARDVCALAADRAGAFLVGSGIGGVRRHVPGGASVALDGGAARRGRWDNHFIAL